LIVDGINRNMIALGESGERKGRVVLLPSFQLSLHATAAQATLAWR